MSESTTNEEPLAKANRLLENKQLDESLDILRRYWLENPQDAQAIKLLSKAMKAAGNGDLAKELKKLSEYPESIEHDVQSLFDTGFKLIDAREMQLAVMLLQRCHEKMPEQATVAYELGFALMALQRFDEAISPFQLVYKTSPDFDTALNLCVCYTLTRQLAAASELLDTMEALAFDDEQKAELALRKTVIRRLEKFANRKELTPRDWLYVMYGTLLLSEPDPSELTESVKAANENRLFVNTAGKSGSNTPDYKAVAWTLITLQKVLSELGLEFDVVEFYSPMSRPLAEALGHIMDLPARSFGGTDSRDRALMIMCWAPNIEGPHKNFLDNKPNRLLFAYGLSTLQPLPLTPDVVAELSTDCLMPWAPSSEEEADQRAPRAGVDLPDAYQAKAMERILEQVSELESRPEIIQTVEELVAYYEPKRDLLVAGNSKKFPSRPEYTAEVVFG